MAEQELEMAINEYQALGGTIIVMEPSTGDVLAMASYPNFEPNQYADYVDNQEIFQNPAVQWEYEPGSIFKMITVASALESGIVTPDTVYVCQGAIEVGGRIIRNWDGRAYGPRNITEILGYSLNTGTAWLSTSLGAERFYAQLDAFGFGEQTGIDLGSEALGFVKHPGDGIWHASDLGTNAFGQGIAVTPIQMASAAASLLNDGQLMRPRVVKAIINHGRIEETEIEVRGQSVSPEVADMMQGMLANSVEMETQTALIEGWRIGGKTGTAQKPIPGGYHPTDTIASFIGYAPADDPAFIVLIKLDRPLGVYQWGSQSAAPLFHRLAQRILHYYNIPPDMHRMALPAPSGNVEPEQSLVSEPAPAP
jgi:cell division protein FtsI/penicillin-binding protein 2